MGRLDWLNKGIELVSKGTTFVGTQYQRFQAGRAGIKAAKAVDKLEDTTVAYQKAVEAQTALEKAADAREKAMAFKARANQLMKQSKVAPDAATKSKLIRQADSKLKGAKNAEKIAAASRADAIAGAKVAGKALPAKTLGEHLKTLAVLSGPAMGAVYLVPMFQSALNIKDATQQEASNKSELDTQASRVASHGKEAVTMTDEFSKRLENKILGPLKEAVKNEKVGSDKYSQAKLKASEQLNELLKDTSLRSDENKELALNAINNAVVDVHLVDIIKTFKAGVNSAKLTSDTYNTAYKKATESIEKLKTDNKITDEGAMYALDTLALSVLSVDIKFGLDPLMNEYYEIKQKGKANITNFAEPLKAAGNKVLQFLEQKKQSGLVSAHIIEVYRKKLNINQQVGAAEATEIYSTIKAIVEKMPEEKDGNQMSAYLEELKNLYSKLVQLKKDGKIDELDLTNTSYTEALKLLAAVGIPEKLDDSSKASLADIESAIKTDLEGKPFDSNLVKTTWEKASKSLAEKISSGALQEALKKQSEDHLKERVLMAAVVGDLMKASENGTKFLPDNKDFANAVTTLGERLDKLKDAGIISYEERAKIGKGGVIEKSGKEWFTLDVMDDLLPKDVRDKLSNLQKGDSNKKPTDQLNDLKNYVNELTTKNQLPKLYADFLNAMITKQGEQLSAAEKAAPADDANSAAPAAKTGEGKAADVQTLDDRNKEAVDAVLALQKKLFTALQSEDVEGINVKGILANLPSIAEKISKQTKPTEKTEEEVKQLQVLQALILPVIMNIHSLVKPDASEEKGSNTFKDPYLTKNQYSSFIANLIKLFTHEKVNAPLAVKLFKLNELADYDTATPVMKELKAATEKAEGRTAEKPAEGKADTEVKPEAGKSETGTPKTEKSPTSEAAEPPAESPATTEKKEKAVVTAQDPAATAEDTTAPEQPPVVTASEPDTTAATPTETKPVASNVAEDNQVGEQAFQAAKFYAGASQNTTDIDPNVFSQFIRNTGEAFKVANAKGSNTVDNVDPNSASYVADVGNFKITAQEVGRKVVIDYGKPLRDQLESLNTGTGSLGGSLGGDANDSLINPLGGSNNMMAYMEPVLKQMRVPKDIRLVSVKVEDTRQPNNKAVMVSYNTINGQAQAIPNQPISATRLTSVTAEEMAERNTTMLNGLVNAIPGAEVV
jgi:hypothetical protein